LFQSPGIRTLIKRIVENKSPLRNSIFSGIQPSPYKAAAAA
jgi:hypothetical protein